ncbi:MAG: class I SAM-dependent methyltransferase [Candidatus Latescibacteria bacterium]|nr:class I SAM-dependent methyltransferase [Candidatus Latescibacterota bacterium]
MKRCLQSHINLSQKILEMGTGPFALLSIFLHRKYHCTVHACDINENYVDSALKCIKMNNSSVNVFQSDLFEHITGQYDIIFFNSVYIPTARGIADGIDRLHEHVTDWCGGRDGTESIYKFLINAKKHLLPNSKLLLGFNRSYLKEAALKKVCASCGYTLSDTCSFPLYPSLIFVLTL